MPAPREVGQITATGNLDGAEPGQMIGRELDVQDLHPDSFQVVHQPDQADLGGIGSTALRTGKHRLPHEDTAESNAVETTHQTPVPPGLHRVGQAPGMQIPVGPDESFVDPRVLRMAPPRAA